MITLSADDLALIRSLPAPPKATLFIRAYTGHLWVSVSDGPTVVLRKPWRLAQPLSISMTRATFDCINDPLLVALWYEYLHDEEREKPWFLFDIKVQNGAVELKPYMKWLLELRKELKAAAREDVPITLSYNLQAVLDKYGDLMDQKDRMRDTLTISRNEETGYIEVNDVPWHKPDPKDMNRGIRASSPTLQMRRLQPDYLQSLGDIIAARAKFGKMLKKHQSHIWHLTETGLSIEPVTKGDDMELPAEHLHVGYCLRDLGEIKAHIPLWVESLLIQHSRPDAMIAVTHWTLEKTAMVRLFVPGMEIFLRTTAEQLDSRCLRGDPIRPATEKPHQCGQWNKDCEQWHHDLNYDAARKMNDLPPALRIPLLAEIHKHFQAMHPDTKLLKSDKDAYFTQCGRARKGEEAFWRLLKDYYPWLSRNGHFSPHQSIIHAYEVVTGEQWQRQQVIAA